MLLLLHPQIYIICRKNRLVSYIYVLMWRVGFLCVLSDVSTARNATDRFPYSVQVSYPMETSRPFR